MEQERILALSEHIAKLLATVAPKHGIRESRIKEVVTTCGRLDGGIVPLGLVMGAAASIEQEQVQLFLTRFPNVLHESALAALDTVSETLLMVSDPDLQASGIMATSLVFQKALPEALPGRDRMLETLLDLVSVQYRDRASRHEQVFAPLTNADQAPTLGALRHFLTEISDALEDVACEKEVFLDNPVELVATEQETTDESIEDRFKSARVKSGSDIPLLSEELAQIDSLRDAMAWPRERALELAADLYERKVMDARSKLGLSLATIGTIVSELKDAFGTTPTDIKIHEGQAADPYWFDLDEGTVFLNLRTPGSLTTRAVNAAREGVLEKLRIDKKDREATSLEKAIERYREAREASGVSNPAPEDEESAAIGTLAVHLGMAQDATFDLVAGLHRSKDLALSGDTDTGVSIALINEIIESIGPGAVKAIALKPDVVLRPISLEDGVLLLHPSFRPLNRATIQSSLAERTLAPQPLATPSEEFDADYTDRDKPGSTSHPKNLKALVNEFKLNDELASDSFDVILESCPGIKDNVSMQTLRVLVATLNKHLGEGAKIDIVTAFDRDLPTGKPDYGSIAWLAVDDETDEKLNMLTFNFCYGEKGNYPPLTDEIVLDWCRHYRPPAGMVGRESV